MGAWRATSETMCDAMVWQHNGLFLYYHSRWNVWWIADKVVSQEDRPQGDDDQWTGVTVYGISGIVHQGEYVPGGLLYVPWNSHQSHLEHFKMMAKPNFVLEMTNELWQYYQSGCSAGLKLKELNAKGEGELLELQQLCAKQQQELSELQSQKDLQLQELLVLKQQKAELEDEL